MKKKYFIGILILLLVAAIWFVSNAYFKKPAQAQKLTPEVKVSATEIFTAFEKNMHTANEQYLGKVIAVQGIVSGVEASTIVLGNSNVSVRCAMDSSAFPAMQKITPGTTLSIKGVCTGFNADDLLGSDVMLNRCTIVTEK